MICKHATQGCNAPEGECIGACVTDRRPVAVMRPASTTRTAKQLTPHQQRVEQLVLRGMSNKAIAFETCTSEQTVKAHISAVMRARGVRCRAELVAKSNTGVLQALIRMRDLCVAMDAEEITQRPTEDEYQAAIAQATDAIESAPA